MSIKLMPEIMKLTAKMAVTQSRKMLPSAEYEECETKECKITMPDGIRLTATVSSPDFGRKWPVVVMRYPYIAYDWMREIYHKLFAEHGYACVLVQVRGTTRSEGEFLVMQEDTDGRAVLDWVVEQLWCDGNIVTIGASYCGNTQWSIADCRHPYLKTMYISVFGAEGYNTFYHRGLFNMEVWTEWSAQMMGDNKYDMLTGKAAENLRNRAFSAYPQSRLGEQLIGRTCDWYKDWISNTEPEDEYWTTGYWKKLESMAEKLDIPVFLHAGYFDIFYHAMLKSYNRIPEEIRKQSVFMIGPWAHSGMSGGDLKYPGADKAGFLQIVSAIKWFDYVIKGREYTEPVGCVEAYNIGGDKWEAWDNGFTHDKEISVYLDSMTWRSGAFIAADNIPRRDGAVNFKYDPEDPVPSRGGRLIANHNKATGTAECSCLQEAPGTRSDVISFISEPFDRKTHITGSVKAEIFVSSDVPATAFTVKVSEVHSNGETYNIQDDYSDIRWRTPDERSDYEPGSMRKMEFAMPDISWTLAPGSSIRIDISSSDYPRFAPHMNTTEKWADVRKGRQARQTIYTGPEHPSRVILPVTSI